MREAWTRSAVRGKEKRSLRERQQPFERTILRNKKGERERNSLDSTVNGELAL